MRTKPLVWDAPAPTADSPPDKVNQQSFDDSLVKDLSEELARPAIKEAPIVKTEVSEAITQVTTTAAEEVAATSTEQEPTAGDVQTGVVKLKEKIVQSINENIADPKRASKSALRLFNTIRLFVYPLLYKKIIFEGQEANDLDKVLKVVADFKQKPENQGKDVIPALNDYQRTIYKKYLDYERHKKGVMWTPEELDQINEVAYLKIAEIKFLRWLMENEWALVLIVIESKRWAPVAGTRMGITDMDLSLF